MTKTKILLGISLAAVFAISMTMTSAMADIPGSMTIVSASSEDGTHTLNVEDKIKQIPAKKAPGLVTFWAFLIPTPDDAPAGTVLTVDAITIHHGVNDHQAFGKAAQSTPVQSFHPHQAHFDSSLCVIGLESPKADFKVQHKTVTLESSDGDAFAAATGTIGPRDECTATGLGIELPLVSVAGIP